MTIIHYTTVNEDFDFIEHSYVVQPELADEVLAWVNARGWPSDQWLVRRSPTEHDIGIVLVRRYSLDDGREAESALDQIANFEDEWRHRRAVDWADAPR